MAEILGLECSHGPIILTPPEAWAKGRERVFARIPNYQPPAQLLEEVGQDNGLSRDKYDQQRVVESFKVLHDRLHAWNPDVLMIIGDDQAENFLPDNLPPCGGGLLELVAQLFGSQVPVSRYRSRH